MQITTNPLLQSQITQYAAQQTDTGNRQQLRTQPQTAPAEKTEEAATKITLSAEARSLSSTQQASSPERSELQAAAEPARRQNETNNQQKQARTAAGSATRVDLIA